MVLFFSCTMKKDMNNYLTGEKKKYWDLIDSTNHPEWCYSFSKDGKCIYYYYQGKNCKRNIMYDGDVEYENTWVLKNDSILRYRSHDRKIIILNEDTLLTEYKGLKTLLLKSKCQVMW